MIGRFPRRTASVSAVPVGVVADRAGRHFSVVADSPNVADESQPKDAPARKV